MIKKLVLPALLAAAAFAGAPSAFAASDTSTPTSATATTQSSSTAGASASATQPATATSTAQISGSTGSATQPASPSTTKTSTPATASSSSKTNYVWLSDRVKPGDLASFGAAKISLQDAIASAASDLHGTAVEAAFRKGPRRPHYVVWVVNEGRVLTADVNPETGAVERVGTAMADHRLYPSERYDFAQTERARMDLAEAVSFAQKQTGSPPIAAGLVRYDRTQGYQVAFVYKGILQKVWVSPNNPPKPIAG